MTTNLELTQTLSVLRRTLAKRRAARKTETDTHLHAFDAVSQHITAQSDNPLLEQSFRAYAVLERLRELETQGQHSTFECSEVPSQDSLLDLPNAQELQDFQRALQT
jgi:hypothetical protein